MSVSAALDLGPHNGDEVDILLMHSTAKTKALKRMLFTIQTDWSEVKGTTVISFAIYDVTGREVVCQGDVDFGVTSNEVELNAIL